MNYSTTPTPQFVLELIFTLCKSTANYVANRLHSKSERDAYLNGMNTAMQAIKAFQGSGAASSVLQKYIDNAEGPYPKGLFFKQNEERARYVQALTHALEINNNLQARFVDGMSDHAPKIFKNVGFIYDDKDYFS